MGFLQFFFKIITGGSLSFFSMPMFPGSPKPFGGILLKFLSFAFVFLFYFSSTVQGQLVQRPIKRNPQSSRDFIQGRIQALLPLPLPFWDDFSNASSGFPDTLWENSQSVWVNNGAAIHPPTLGVVTFDGLDSLNQPYSLDPMINGFGDKLISRKIKLGDVPANQRDSLFISFYFQWMGNREAPDAQDFIQLEFLNNLGQWVVAEKINPLNFNRQLFYPIILKVADPSFFHNDFQFRFRSYGRLSGAYDSWNIDYVYLNMHRHINDLYFPDRAICNPLGPLFGAFRAVPLHHFRSGIPFTKPALEVYNLQNAATTVNYRTYGIFDNTDLKTNTTTTYQTLLSKATPLQITFNSILSRERVFTVVDSLPDPNDALQFDPNADSVAVTLKVALRTRDNVPLNYVAPVENDSTGDYDYKIFSPIDFRVNDTLKNTYILSDFYAYDDGSPEYTIELTQAGNKIAYQFDIPIAGKDTLVGFDIFIPDFTIPSGITLDFFIYQDDAGIPAPFPFTIPARTITKNGNLFKRIRFQPAQLVGNRFYLGWKEPGAGTVKVGLDKSGDSGGKIWVNTNGFWVQNNSIVGHLMIRPIFGSGPVDIITGLENTFSPASVFPNPNKGSFYVRGWDKIVGVYDLTGSMVLFKEEDFGDDRKITLEHNTSGFYILQGIQGNHPITVRFMVW